MYSKLNLKIIKIKMIKKTKIVATIGPATESQEMLEKLLKVGMNVMRLNFSHGDFAEHQARVDNFRKASEVTGLPGAILQDLGGPKIRLGMFKEEKVELVADQSIVITTEDIIGDEKRVSINYPEFPKEVKVGDFVMVDDGKKRLEVTNINGNDVECKIIIGGTTKGRRGVNLPNSDLSVRSLTEKDLKDLEFGLKNEVDFVALSFVRRPEDISDLREILNKRNSKACIIAKIETPQAVKNIDEIIRLSDGIMVARGDLAIEVPFEKVPMIQKMIIEKCNKLGKPIITATQMLESMIQSPVATRAEVSDVANAILDGTDAIMLSEETTLGKYPIVAVQTMAKIALEIEKTAGEKIVIEHDNNETINIANSITRSVVRVAHEIKVKKIVALTESGFTARMISRHHPKQNVLAISPNMVTCRQLCLSYGCIPIHTGGYKTLQDVFDIVRSYCLKENLAEVGDKVIIASGAPFNTKGVTTNMMMIETL
jgi:pyruvate kinase